MSGQNSSAEQTVFPEWKSFLGTQKEEKSAMFIKHVVKRSGEIGDYDRSKISTAIGKAVESVEKRANPDKAEQLTDKVEEKLSGAALAVKMCRLI